MLKAYFVTCLKHYFIGSRLLSFSNIYFHYLYILNMYMKTVTRAWKKFCFVVLIYSAFSLAKYDFRIQFPCNKIIRFQVLSLIS